jgi:hypothetical protein
MARLPVSVRSSLAMSFPSGLRSLLAATIVLGGMACSSPTSPGDGPFQAEVTLRPGQVTAVASTPLRIGFDRVAADSRCPATAFCIQSGDALVALTVSVEGRAGAEVLLRTRGGTSGSELSVVVAGYELAVSGLQPYPETTTPIPPGDYRVTVRIARD